MSRTSSEPEYRQLRGSVVLVEVDDYLRVRCRGANEVKIENAWWGNYGGHDLVISPDERYLVISIFSGQSTQGWELFQLVPTTEHLGGLRDTHGTGTAPVFAPDSRWLAMVLTGVDARWRDTKTRFEDRLDPDSDERSILDWATLFIQRLPDGAIEEHTIGVSLPCSINRDVVHEWDMYERVRFTGPDTVELALPWDERLAVPLPVAGPITASTEVEP
jgi:hypothetical protein